MAESICNACKKMKDTKYMVRPSNIHANYTLCKKCKSDKQKASEDEYINGLLYNENGMVIKVRPYGGVSQNKGSKTTNYEAQVYSKDLSL